MRNVYTLLFLPLACSAAFGQSGKSPIREIHFSAIPKPVAPATLTVSDVSFTDDSGNSDQVLDANETAYVRLILNNTGKGHAYNLTAETKMLRTVNGISFSDSHGFGDLAPGQRKEIAIPFSATSELETGKAEFLVAINEGNGFNADPFTISFSTARMKSPLIAIADHRFSTDEGGKIKLGKPVTLEVVIQNQGQGPGLDIEVNFLNPQNIFPANESTFSLGTLKPNEIKTIVYEFFPNKKFLDAEIPIQVITRERSGKFGETKTLSVSLDKNIDATRNKIEISGREQNDAIKIDDVYLTSDVDRDIPQNKKVNSERFALVVGNEDYKRFQPTLQNDQNVAFARNDASVVKDYLIKTWGFPEKQVVFLADATFGQMNRELTRIIELAKLTPEAEIVFYYAGHGLPDPETRQAYLMPVDVTAANLKDGISLKDLYGRLATAQAAKVLVLLDACFSGGGRGENGLLAARTVKVKPKGDLVDGNIVVFTATSGEEASLPLASQSHGLFTYYVLSKLKESKGDLTLDELKKYLEAEIPKASLLENSMKQTPQVLVAPKVGDQWLNWKF